MMQPAIRSRLAQTEKHAVPHETSYFSTPVHRIPFPEDKLQVIQWLFICIAPLEDAFDVQVICDKVGRL